MLNWDDLRVFGVAARSASLAAAGQTLGMDASTVSRRILRLESLLKATLVVRSPNGLQLTQAGLELRDVARRVEEAMVATRHPGGAAAISGVVRVSLPQGLSGAIFARPLLQRASPYADLNVELAENAGDADLSRGDADIVVSLNRPAASGVLAEELGALEIGLFAHPDYLARAGAPGSPGDLAKLSYLRLLEPGPAEGDQTFAAQLRPRLTTRSLALHLQLIREAAGVGFLPHVLGEAAGLRRLLPDQVRGHRTLWMATGREYAETARCRAVRGWLREAFQAAVAAARPVERAPFASVVPFSTAAAEVLEHKTRRRA